MKNFSVTEETYIEKYYTEEKKFSQIKEKIETTLKYPGTIKIAVVRETRALEEAK